MAGIDGFFEELRKEQAKMQIRVFIARFRGKSECPSCHGRRLRPRPNMSVLQENQ